MVATFVTAVGFDYGTSGGPGIRVVLADGETYDLPAIRPPTDSPSFAGFITTSAIASLTIASLDTDATPMLDQFQFGEAAAVPEPTSIVSASLAAAGLLAAALVRRRRVSEA